MATEEKANKQTEEKKNLLPAVPGLKLDAVQPNQSCLDWGLCRRFLSRSKGNESMGPFEIFTWICSGLPVTFFVNVLDIFYMKQEKIL